MPKLGISEHEIVKIRKKEETLELFWTQIMMAILDPSANQHSQSSPHSRGRIGCADWLVDTKRPQEFENFNGTTFHHNSISKPLNRGVTANWVPKTGWASSNAARRPLPGSAFYLAKNWVGNCPPCPPASYAPVEHWVTLFFMHNILSTIAVKRYKRKKIRTILFEVTATT